MRMTKHIKQYKPEKGESLGSASPIPASVVTPKTSETEYVIMAGNTSGKNPAIPLVSITSHIITQPGLLHSRQVDLHYLTSLAITTKRAGWIAI